MGQRAVAEATRKEYNIKKFSHSTVSRSFKGLEESRKAGLEQRFGEEMPECGKNLPNHVNAAIKPEAKKAGSPNPAKQFPTTKETAKRRKEMAIFLQEILNTPEKGNIETASREFVENWHKKTRRLLL